MPPNLVLAIQTLSPRQHTTTSSILPSLSSPSSYLISPLLNLEDPATSNKYTTNHINQSDQQIQHTTPLLRNCQHQRLDIELYEDTRDLAFGYDVRLFGDGVLVCEDCVAWEMSVCVCLVAAAEWDGGGRVLLEGGGVVGVDCGDDGEVVLEFFKVLVGGCACVVEGVVEAWVKGTETQFVDLVGEVECCGYCVRRER